MSETPPRDLSFAERWQRSQDEVSRLRDQRPGEEAKPDDAAAPARCPVCRSQDVKTTSKVQSAESYWRCESCGEVWNVGRHRAGARYARDLPPFRR